MGQSEGESVQPPVHIRAPGWVGEFRAFVMRGNVVDLAVGIIIGAASDRAVERLREVYRPIVDRAGCPTPRRQGPTFLNSTALNCSSA